MGEKLDITSLEKASDSFTNVLKYAKEIESNKKNNIFYAEEAARAAVIQHFEYTYELSWKMMKRFIEIDDGREDSLTRKGLFRRAGEIGLIDDFYKWVEFHNARNLTSYTYDEDIAEEVYASAKKFDNYVKQLISVLNEKIRDF